MKKVILSAILIPAMLFLVSCAKETPKTSDTVSDAVPSQTGEEEAAVINPITEMTEKEAKEIYSRSFRVPERAENVKWSKIKNPGSSKASLIQFDFVLDGKRFAAREEKTGKTENYSHGMYCEWTVSEPFSFVDKNGTSLSGEYSRYVGEKESVDLCTWYDAKAGMSYSLSVVAANLDGFDLQAIVEEITP